ncbi:MAG TPA: molybdopterin biosynthesis protein MoeB [Hyphomonadaceae bacterium]|nr:molybdopterin biosynthesis protein MoeB [Hyphomonadaceae bacterium]
MDQPFSPDEIDRYQRHLLLREIGGVGQQRLKQAKVALIGCGGLGAPAALYLAAAGVGTLRLIDDDVVSRSNLQRQVLFADRDVGALKVEAGARALTALNPHCEIEPRPIRLDAETGEALLAGVDLVLDGSDNFATRHRVNRLCVAARRPLIAGAVGRFDGQIGLFAPHQGGDDAACYHCFAGEAAGEDDVCAREGVIGALTGVIGAMMALEAIKWIAGAGASLRGHLLVFDGLNAQWRRLRVLADPLCPVCAAPLQE